MGFDIHSVWSRNDMLGSMCGVETNECGVETAFAELLLCGFDICLFLFDRTAKIDPT